MAMKFSEENTASRRKLEALVKRLSPQDYALRTPYDWSVSALLAHLAWWDQRVLVLLRRWKEVGVDESPLDNQAINEALKPLCHALEPQQAVQLCLESARLTDAEIETTDPALMAQIEASPNHFRFNRSLHRSDHIRDIEQLLG